jgi:hypothetical protein
MAPTINCVPQEDDMRESLSHHFDVVVVVWVLALALGWSLVTLSRAQLPGNQWSGAQQNGPAWVIPSGDPAQ